MKEYKTVPNQRIIKMPPVGERIRDKNHLYGMFSIEEAQKVAKNLGASAFVLYMYFQKNQDNYEFALSKVDIESWGLGKTAYTNAFNALVANGYLERKNDNSNIYFFHEMPQEEDTSVVSSHNHEKDNDILRGNATIPHVVTPRDNTWYCHDTTRGNAALPEIIHNNTKDNKINNTFLSGAKAPLGSAASGAAENYNVRKEMEKRNTETRIKYTEEVKVLNNQFFAGMEELQKKFGAGYEDTEEYKEFRNAIYAKINELKVKYNIG